MGLDTLIKQQVRLAFAKIGDLAISVTLIQRDAASFNFGTGAASSTAPVTTTVKAVREKIKRPDGGAQEPNTVKAVLLFSSEDVSDFSVYDKATFESKDWVVCHPVENDGYTTKVTMSRTG